MRPSCTTCFFSKKWANKSVLRLCLFISLSLLTIPFADVFAAETQSAAATFTPRARYKLRISAPAIAAQVAASGGVLVGDYGSFQIFKVNDAVFAQFAGQLNVENVS